MQPQRFKKWNRAGEFRHDPAYNHACPPKEPILHRMSLTIRIVCLCVLVNFTAGCGVELAMLGAASSAASSGSAVYKRGKLNASWMASFDEVVAAGEAAFDDLGMKVTRSKGNEKKGKWAIVAVNDDKNKVKLKVDHKASRLTEFQIDVGLFGKEPTARLILKRMAVALQLGATEVGTDEAMYIPAPPSSADERYSH